MKTDRKTVLMLYSVFNSKSAEMLSGVANYASKRNWRLMIVDRREVIDIRATLAAFKPDGCIVHGGVDETLGIRKVRETDFEALPTVFFAVDTTGFKHLVYSVDIDSYEVGRLAAKKLTSLKLAAYAYLPWPYKAHWCTERQRGFCETIARLTGHVPAIYRTPSTTESARSRDFYGFVRKLPRPLGIFASTDSAAWNVSQVAELLGIDIGRDVAMLGSDNSEVLCENARPSLSSVAIDFVESGRMAAQLLDEVMSGRVKRPVTRLIRPSTVISRESTDLGSTTNESVQKALSLIRERACEGLSAREVVEALGKSRRTAERLFERETGKSILTAINDVRLDKAKELLRRRITDISAIADICGWSSSGYLRRIFREKTGMSLTEWRDAPVEKRQ